MQIGLTGATGFVGRRCVEQFLSRGWDVRAWYRGSRPPESEGVDWVSGELDDPEAADRLVEGCDHVVHTALWRQSDSFMSEPADAVAYYQTNVVGTLRLIEAAKRREQSRFVFLSSGAVHEKVASDLPLDERHPLWPASMYGACKASAETLIHAYGLSDKLVAATIRPVSIVGIDDPVSHSKWYELVKSVAEGRRTDVSGGGKVVFVDDVVSAIELMLETSEPIAGETFNLCSGFITHHEVASIAKELSGSDAELVGEPKNSKNPMQTTKIEKLGMRLGAGAKLREVIGELLSGAQSA